MPFLPGNRPKGGAKLSPSRGAAQCDVPRESVMFPEQGSPGNRRGAGGEVRASGTSAAVRR
ncbi:hypothetical protein SUDANB140_00202 [Streptomyces sp. enrichment culture]